MKNQEKLRTGGQSENSWVVHFVGLIGCVGLPAFATAIAPVGVTHFERRDGSVTATIRWNLLFVIPYHRAEVRNVTSIDDRFHAGQMTEVPGTTGGDTNSRVRSEDEAFLVVHGESGDREVPVSPVSIRRCLERAQGFLKDENATDLTLVTVANYKFGILAGGVLSLLTVLYVFGVVMSVGRFVWRLIRGA